VTEVCNDFLKTKKQKQKKTQNIRIVNLSHGRYVQACSVDKSGLSALLVTVSRLTFILYFNMTFQNLYKHYFRGRVNSGKPFTAYWSRDAPTV